MQEGTIGSFQLIKSLNRSIILNKIRLHAPISRAEIAKQTTLTPPTVSNIVKELLENGIVVETNQGESSGGRKPTLLKINSNAYYMIGIDIGPKYLRIITANLNGTILQSAQKSIPIPISNQTLLDFVTQQIYTLIQAHEQEIEKFIGIGVGMHGVVDVLRGESLYAPSLNLRQIPIKEALETEFKLPVFVENDARVMALGEAWFGKGSHSENFITVNVGRGIGAGIMINGKLFYGENFIAGEIGHMTIDLAGIRCSCGNYGCLETVAAGPALTERIKREISMGKESLIKQWVKDDLNQINGKLVFEAAKSGDQLSIEVLNQTGRYLGIGLTNLIHIMNPKHVILAGGVSRAGDFILNSVRETIETRALTPSAKKTEIVLSDFDEYGTAIGAITLILNQLYSGT